MKNKIALCIFLLIILIIFRNLFIAGVTLSAGDWPYRFPESFSGISFNPYLWDPLFSQNIGGNIVFLVALNTYYIDTGYLLSNIFHLPWELIERYIWFLPCIILAYFSCSYFLRNIFSKLHEVYILIGCFVFITNTYFLMMIGGGQIGVGMAYAFVPFMLIKFMRLADSSYSNYFKSFRSAVIVGSLFALQILFDIRIAYMTISAVILYFAFTIKYTREKEIIMNNCLLFFFSIIVPLSFAGLLHAFWVLPLFVTHQNPEEQLGSVYTSLASVQYFSFAKIEDTISLLQPYWPENIFGKVSFMRPEFLILPILAYASLVFLESKIFVKNQKTTNNKTIVYFALLGLIGAFLASGANNPFGRIYLWLFSHVPGFIMFRDPMKWYTLIAISYTALIPFTIWKICELLKQKGKFSIKSKIFTAQNLFLFVIIFYLLYLVRPALLDRLGGTFNPQPVRQEYLTFKDFITKQPSYFRTFWVPQASRYGFSSYNHPNISGDTYFTIFDNDKLLTKLTNKNTLSLLQQASVKYIIVPYDPRGEIFIKDRKYSDQEYRKTIKELENITWLKRINGFYKIAIYEVPQYKDHFWSPSQKMTIRSKFINPTSYIVSVKGAKKGDRLVFTEGFDPHWEITTINGHLSNGSSKYNGRFNSFILLKDGDYSMKVYYQPQQWVNVGVWISIMTLVFVVVSAIIL